MIPEYSGIYRLRKPSLFLLDVFLDFLDATPDTRSPPKETFG